MRNNNGCGCGSFIVLLVLIFLGSMLFSSCGKSKDKKEENVADWKNIKLEDVNPADSKFKDELQKLCGEDITVDYVPETKFLSITYNVDSVVKFKWQLERFARESGQMLATFYKNKDIDKVDFALKVKVEDGRGNKSDMIVAFATYTKENMNNINYNNWVDSLYNSNDAMNFFIIADRYDIKEIGLKELSQKQLDILNR